MTARYFPALLVLGLSIVVSLAAQLMPRPDKQMAVIFPAGSSFAENFAAATSAGAQVVRSGIAPNILIVYSQAPDDLYRHGAVAVVNAVIEGGCFLSPPKV